METIVLKGIDQPASRLCIGGCPAGEYGWGNVSREEIEAGMLRALELGVNFLIPPIPMGLADPKSPWVRFSTRIATA